jgi:hypothetical protein
LGHSRSLWLKYAAVAREVVAGHPL